MLKLWESVRGKPIQAILGALPKEKSLYPQYPYEAKNLPAAPKNPYLKRPTSVKYNDLDYMRFRLPSEEAYLLGHLDYSKVFGTSKGYTHSPKVLAQHKLDNGMVWLYFFATLGMMMGEWKRND